MKDKILLRLLSNILLFNPFWLICVHPWVFYSHFCCCGKNSVNSLFCFLYLWLCCVLLSADAPTGIIFKTSNWAHCHQGQACKSLKELVPNVLIKPLSGRVSTQECWSAITKSWLLLGSRHRLRCCISFFKASFIFSVVLIKIRLTNHVMALVQTSPNMNCS